MGNEFEGEYGVCVTDSQWEAVCERAGFVCPECGEYPSVGDIDVFLDEGVCGECWAKWQRAFRD